MLRMIAMLGALALAACGSSGGNAPRTGVPGYAGGDTSCVPYARSRSGIDLQGDAWQWWDAAANSGRYDRSRRPRTGSVLVFMRTSRNRTGHLSVVTRVVGPREIRVDHANWAVGAQSRPGGARPAGDGCLAQQRLVAGAGLVSAGERPGPDQLPDLGFIHGGRLVAEAR